jgi:hypothetical protein
LQLHSGMQNRRTRTISFDRFLRSFIRTVFPSVFTSYCNSWILGLSNIVLCGWPLNSLWISQGYQQCVDGLFTLCWWTVNIMWFPQKRNLPSYNGVTISHWRKERTIVY